jgi:methylmalonyl-CoA/ethylmalonyl-CoA epimerase
MGRGPDWEQGKRRANLKESICRLATRSLFMVMDHIAFVVSSLERGLAQWRDDFGYTQMTEPVENSLQKVRVVFLRNGDSVVKLVEPSGETSPVYRLAARGGGLHHICFRCADLHAEIERLVAEGARVLAAPQPGEAFEGEEIAFLFCNNGLNVELIETDKKARLIKLDKD